MNFSSNIFIFYFLLLFLVSFLILKKIELNNPVFKRLRISDILTIVFSLGFYAWAFFDNIYFIIFLIVTVFVLGVLIKRFRKAPDSNEKKKGVSFWITLAGTVAMIFALYYYKYQGEFSLGILSADGIIAPLGISFLSFSVISYLVDVYKGAPSGNFIDVALYLSFFPKVISGPIILWENFQSQLDKRTLSLDNVSRGTAKIIYGLAKKVMIADYFGAVIQNIQTDTGGNIDIQTGWLICLLYMFQIYFDFSGYSDVAIGISNVTGFEFDNNFNFPYVSTSISEFWRRWHMSLGQWFKKYLYIPLGGNRKGRIRTLINNFIVMFVSGIWHGAGLGYLLWGTVHGACIVFEKGFKDARWFNKIPKALKWVVTMFIVMMGWVVFRLNSFDEVWEHFRFLFGRIKIPEADIRFTYEYYISPKLIAMLVIAVLGSTLLSKVFASATIVNRLNGSKVFTIVKYVALLLLFVGVLACMANSTYSPFIYFQY